METFLFVLLLILKILGITLLALLGLILIVICLVLFVPFRYYAEGYYKEGDYDIKAKVTFLLHILSVTFDLKAEENIVIKIFGIKYKFKKEEAEDVSGEQETDFSSDGESDESPPTEAEKPGENVPTEEEHAGEEEQASLKEEKKSQKKKKKSTNKEIYAKIKEYIAVARTEDFRNTLAAFKKMAISALKVVLPKKWKAEGKVGFEDPYTNGQICALMGALYPVLYKHSTIYCDFEQPGIDVSGWFKGRIIAIRFVLLGIRLLLNKSVRKMIIFVIKQL